MAKYIKQHYVPSFYLKQFGRELYCYDKHLDKTYKTNYQNLGYSKLFYDTPSSKDTFEQYLAMLDNKFAPIYAEIIKNESLHNIKNIYVFFIFLSCQMWRTKDKRKEIKNMLQGVRMKLKGSRLENQIPSDEDEIKTFQMGMLLDPLFEFSNILSKKKWVILKNNTTKSLFTSDNPFVLHNSLKFRPFTGNLGLLVKGIEIHFPLNNNLVLYSYDETTHRIKYSSCEMEPENVKHENFLQTINSSRFLYSQTDDFSLMREFLHENPQFKSPPPRGHIA